MEFLYNSKLSAVFEIQTARIQAESRKRKTLKIEKKTQKFMKIIQK